MLPFGCPMTADADLPADQSRMIALAVRDALARRRLSRQALADAARISISTLEKALAGRRPFTLATTVRLEEALGLSLREAEAMPATTTPAGPHARATVTWLEGRYLTLRPSFGAPDCIFAYTTEIVWEPQSNRLVFREGERLDAPFAQTGFVSVPPQSGTIYLVTDVLGQHRLAMLGRPTIRGEMYGLLSTLNVGRGGQLTPSACPLALVPETHLDPAQRSYGRVSPSQTAAYALFRSYLRRVDDDGFGTFFACPA